MLLISIEHFTILKAISLISYLAYWGKKKRLIFGNYKILLIVSTLGKFLAKLCTYW